MAEFMTDEDLEALKADADGETADPGQNTGAQVGEQERQHQLHYC